MTETITLAHLSDLHMSPLKGFTPRHWNVKRGLGYLNWQRGRRFVHSRDVLQRLVADMMMHAPDHVAVTGDLVNIGLPAEYETALGWLEELGSPDRVTVVPGNHDIYVHLRSDPGVRRWQPYMVADAWGAQFATPRHDGFPFVRRVGGIALIGLNSAVPTKPFVAAGRLGHPQLDALGPLLDRARAEGLVRVLLIHHPPLPGKAPRLRGLIDAPELQQVIGRHGAELILHGHNHRDLVTRVTHAAGETTVIGICSSSASRSHHGEPLARYNLLRFKPRNGPGSRIAVELHARGLAEPGGAIVDLDRRALV